VSPDSLTTKRQSVYSRSIVTVLSGLVLIRRNGLVLDAESLGFDAREVIELAS